MNQYCISSNILKNQVYNSTKQFIYSQQITFLAICVPNMANTARLFYIR